MKLHLNSESFSHDLQKIKTRIISNLMKKKRERKIIKSGRRGRENLLTSPVDPEQN